MFSTAETIGGIVLTLAFSFLQELEAIKARVKEMEEEAEKLKEMQNQVDKQMMSPKSAGGLLLVLVSTAVGYLLAST